MLSSQSSVVPLLPTELWDHILDTLALDHQTLAACISVSRALRTRALYHLLSYVELSQVSSTERRSNPSALLDMFEAKPAAYMHLPRRLSLNCLSFNGPAEKVLQNRALRILPTLNRLGELHVQNLDLGGADIPTILTWFFPSIRKLRLDSCIFDTASLDAFLSRFQELAELSIASYVRWDATETDVVYELPWTDCVLDLTIGRGYDSTADGSFKWAAQRNKHFTYHSLHMTPLFQGPMLRERLDIIGPQLQHLSLDLGSSVAFDKYQEALNKSVLAISMCTALETLELRVVQLGDVVCARSVAQTCKSLRVNLLYLSNQTREIVAEEWVAYTGTYSIKDKMLIHKDQVLVSTR